MPASSLRHRLPSLVVLLALLAAIVSLPLVGRAQDSQPAQPEKPQLSEVTYQALVKLQPLMDAKQWDIALRILGDAEQQVKPDSYDQAVIAQYEANLYIQKALYPEAVEKMNIALRLDDAHNYFDKNIKLQMLSTIGQLYAQLASASKSKTTQKLYYNKAVDYFRIWLEQTPEPKVEMVTAYTSLLYNLAMIDSDHPDLGLLRQARAEASRALELTIQPKEQNYVLLLAIDEQLGNWQVAAEQMELLVKIFPAKATYWQQLMSIYSTLASQATRPDLVREFNLRAILTIERAQKLGYMDTPKDNYNLVGLYFNIGEYQKAAELLDKGLHDGGIVSTMQNWQLLAATYQQVNKDLQAVEVLKEAAQLYPGTGRLDYQIAQIYYGLNRSQDTYQYLLKATAKGHLEKPGGAYSFLAFICYDMGKYDEALAAVEKAFTFADTKHDEQLPRLREAIESSIKQREASKAAMARQAI